ncbi:helix-turn-helix domain-containing protein [Paenactinomyces guangxiensis]|uniref:Tetratricopeptide repeat protein n=1 Tax=Paenactinomyces guangxiensis TaxID=1490290 RepID=A0A7W1WRN1_9BACL|nr:helix-turn-helix domain-containing protein [Paenactinomyces guangxiensis]MBA4494775.1 tetratricopeptide repeat protein [Paenactinomyces guangxiensis]MBH8591859.1 tetratricopeptide repeat protein [Paenactinomyces guangxiensis]
MDFKRVGELIRKVRKERGMTLDDLCDDYIPRTTLSSIERGLTQNETKVHYILRKLDIDLSDLWQREKKDEEKRKLDLLLIENIINSDPKKAFSRLTRLPDEYNGPFLVFLKARCYFKLKQYNKATEYFDDALQELEKRPDLSYTNLKPRCLNHKSIIEFQRGNSEKAVRYAEEGLESFDFKGERKHYYINLLSNKSIYLKKLGRKEKALENLEQIKFDSLDINSDAVLGVYVLRTMLKREIKTYEDAIKCAKEGIALAINCYNYERQLALLIELGEIYKESGDFDQAEKCLETAIELKSQITRRHWLIVDAYLELGIVHYKKKDFHKAKKALQKAAEIAKKENTMLKYAQAIIVIAETFLFESNFDHAINYFKEVYELNTGNKEVESRALLGLARVYHLLNDDLNCTKYSKLYIESLGT